MRVSANFPVLRAVLQEELSGSLPKYALSALKPPERSSNSSSNSYSDPPVVGGVFKDRCYVWLARGSVLVVLLSKNSSVVSVYDFNQSFKELRFHVTTCCTCENLIIVGLKSQDGRGCIVAYNPRISKLVKAIDIPYPVTAVETITSYGGAVSSTRCFCKRLRWMFGIAAVGTEEGHLYLVDLRFDSAVEVGSMPSEIEIVPPSLRNVPKTRENIAAKNGYMAFELQAPCHEDGVFHYALPDDEIVESFYPSDATVTTLLYESRTALLFVGFSFGQFQIFSLNDMSLVHSSDFESGSSPVIQFSFQEPENDPRKFCYLWVAKGQKSGTVSSPRNEEPLGLLMFQLAFSEKEVLAKPKQPSRNHCRVLYKNFELCSLRFEHMLDCGSTLHICSIEKYAGGIEHQETDEEDAEYGLSPATSFCIIGWQSSNPSKRRNKAELNIILFDINRWYMAQMPRSFSDDEDDFIYAGFWSFEDNECILSEDEAILGMCVPSDKIHHFVSGMRPLPERYFLPSACSFSLHYVTNLSLNHYSLFGYQQQVLNTLGEMKSMCLVNPKEIHNNILASELYARQATNQTFTPDMMRENILTTALEHGQVSFLLAVVRDLASGQLAACGCTLRFAMDWAWKSVANIKNSIDELCVPIFDCTCPTLDALVKSQLHFNASQINHLRIIFQKLMEYTEDASEQSKEELKTKLNVVTLIHQYLKVVQWFVSKGLLPEQLDNVDNDEEIMTPDGILVYKYTRLRQVFDQRRSELKRLHAPDLLLIDGWIEEIGEPLTSRWIKEKGGKITYPPPSFMTLLDMYYLDCVDVVTKHCLIMYLLYDVLAMFSTLDDESKDTNPDLHESERDRLNSIALFLECFLVPPGLIKLTQGFWLLDHKNFQNALNVFLDPAASRPACSWQERRILRAFLYQGHPAMALKYISTFHPRVETIDDAKLHITIYIKSREPMKAWNLVQTSAGQHDIGELFSHLFTLSQQHSLLDQLLKLPFSASEEETVIKYLKENNSLETSQILVLYYLQHSKYVEAIKLHSQSKHNRLMRDQSEESRRRNSKLDHIVQAYSNLLPKIEREVAFSARGFLKHHASVLREAHKPSTLSAVLHPVKNVKPTSHAGRLVTLMDKMEQRKRSEQDPNLTPLRRRPYGGVIEPKIASESAVIYPTIDLSKRRSSIDIHGIRGRRSSIGSPARFTGSQDMRSTTHSTASQLAPSAVKDRRLSSLSLASMLLRTPPIPRRRQSVGRQDVAQEIQTPQSILKVKQRFRTNKSRSPSLSIISQASSKSYERVVKEADNDNISAESGSIISEASGQFRREIPTISTPSLKLFKRDSLRQPKIEKEQKDFKEEHRPIFDTPKKLRFAGLDASANDSGLSTILSPPVEQVAGLPNLTPVQVAAEDSKDDGEMEVDVTGDEDLYQEKDDTLSLIRHTERPFIEEHEVAKQAELSDVEEEDEFNSKETEENLRKDPVLKVPEMPFGSQPVDEVITLDSSSDEEFHEREDEKKEEEIIVEQEPNRPAQESLRLALTSSEESFALDVAEDGYASEEFTVERDKSPDVISEAIPEIPTPKSHHTLKSVGNSNVVLEEGEASPSINLPVEQDSKHPEEVVEVSPEGAETKEDFYEEGKKELLLEEKHAEVPSESYTGPKNEAEESDYTLQIMTEFKDFEKADNVFESEVSDNDEKPSPELYVPQAIGAPERITVVISDDESNPEDSKPETQKDVVKEMNREDIKDSADMLHQDDSELRLRLSVSEEDFSDDHLMLEEKKDEKVPGSPLTEENALKQDEVTSDYQSMSATKMEQDVTSTDHSQNLITQGIEPKDTEISHVELEAKSEELPENFPTEVLEPDQSSKSLDVGTEAFTPKKLEIIINPITPVVGRVKTDPTFVLSPPTTRRSKRKSSKATQYTPKPAMPRENKVPKSPSRVTRSTSKQTQVTPAPEPTFLFSPPKPRKRSSKKKDQSIIDTSQSTVNLSPPRSATKRTRNKTKSSDADSDKSPSAASPARRSQPKASSESTKKMDSSPEPAPVPSTPSRKTRQSPGRKPPATPTRSSSRIKAKISLIKESKENADSEPPIPEEQLSVSKRTRRRKTSIASDVASSGTDSEVPTTPSRRRSTRRSTPKSKPSPLRDTATKVPELTPLPEEEEEEAINKKRKKEKGKATAPRATRSTTSYATRMRRKAKVLTLEE